MTDSNFSHRHCPPREIPFARRHGARRKAPRVLHGAFALRILAAVPLRRDQRGVRKRGTRQARIGHGAAARSCRLAARLAGLRGPCRPPSSGLATSSRISPRAMWIPTCSTRKRRKSSFLPWRPWNPAARQRIEQGNYADAPPRALGAPPEGRPFLRRSARDGGGRETSGETVSPYSRDCARSSPRSQDLSEIVADEGK